MPRFWTVYWQNRFWRDDVNAQGVPISGSFGSTFHKRGLSKGDVVFVVSVGEGQLYLGGRMVVASIVDHDSPKRVFASTEQIVAAEGATKLDLHRRLAPELTRRLRFVSPNSEPKALFFKSDTDLDVQTTRGVRELTAESATLLDRVIDLTDGQSRSGLLTVTEQMVVGSLNLNPEASSLVHALPEEAGMTTALREGARRQIIVNAYERNAKARDLCIAKYGTNCFVCGVSFLAVYGEAANGLIHVHHLRALSDIGEEYDVIPADDLRPVCPNCHAVIHWRDPAYSIDEVKQFIQQRLQGCS